MPPPPLQKPNLLRDARVYLSGPMDFVADRETERKFGWRKVGSSAFRRSGACGLPSGMESGP
jgi:hypothetical protein